jgi:hypothetical protein
MSNCTVKQKTLDFVYSIPFREVAAREKDDDGGPSKEIGRTLESLLNRLANVFSEGFDLDLAGLD